MASFLAGLFGGKTQEDHNHDKQSTDPTTNVPKTQENQNHNQETADPTINQNPIDKSAEPILRNNENENPDTEEEVECGFCLFMKGGACRETFINWDECVKGCEKNGEDNYANKCAEVTSALMKCVVAHPDYYGALSKAWKDLEQEAKKHGENGLNSSNQEPKVEQEQ